MRLIGQLCRVSPLQQIRFVLILAATSLLLVCQLFAGGYDDSVEHWIGLLKNASERRVAITKLRMLTKSSVVPPLVTALETDSSFQSSDTRVEALSLLEFFEAGDFPAAVTIAAREVQNPVFFSIARGILSSAPDSMARYAFVPLLSALQREERNASKYFELTRILVRFQDSCLNHVSYFLGISKDSMQIEATRRAAFSVWIKTAGLFAVFQFSSADNSLKLFLLDEMKIDVNGRKFIDLILPQKQELTQWMIISLDDSREDVRAAALAAGWATICHFWDRLDGDDASHIRVVEFMEKVTKLKSDDPSEKIRKLCDHLISNSDSIGK